MGQVGGRRADEEEVGGWSGMWVERRSRRRRGDPAGERERDGSVRLRRRGWEGNWAYVGEARGRSLDG